MSGGVRMRDYGLGWAQEQYDRQEGDELYRRKQEEEDGSEDREN